MSAEFASSKMATMVGSSRARADAAVAGAGDGPSMRAAAAASEPAVAREPATMVAMASVVLRMTTSEERERWTAGKRRVPGGLAPRCGAGCDAGCGAGCGAGVTPTGNGYVRVPRLSRIFLT